MNGSFVRINRKAICCYKTHLILCRHQHTIARSHYEVLNLSRNCTHREIRDAFAKLSKQYHPDTCKSGNVQQNTKRFQEIMEAYRVLGKKDSRSSYDASGYTNQTQSNSQQYDQTYHYDYDYQRDRRQTYQNRNQNYGYYSNNRQNNYYDWSTYRVYRPYEKQGKASTSEDPFMKGFTVTNQQILTFLWLFVVFNSVIQFYLANRRARLEREVASQPIKKYEIRSDGAQGELKIVNAEFD